MKRFLSLVCLLVIGACQKNPAYYGGITFDQRYHIVGTTPLSKPPTGSGFYTIWYDKQNRPVKITYSITNTLSPDPFFGVEQIVFSYSPSNEIRFFLDGFNQPKASPTQKYAIAILNYNDKGQATHIKYYDTNYTPATDNRNVFAYEWQRDNHNRILKSTGFSTNKEIVSFMGIASLEWTYNKYGNITEQRFYNDKGVLSSQNFFGYAIEKRIYDKKNRLIEQAFYDEKENPVNYNIWYIHKYRYLYNKKNQLTNIIRYRITNGVLLPIER